GTRSIGGRAFACIRICLAYLVIAYKPAPWVETRGYHRASLRDTPLTFPSEPRTQGTRGVSRPAPRLDPQPLTPRVCCGRGSGNEDANLSGNPFTIGTVATVTRTTCGPHPERYATLSRRLSAATPPDGFCCRTKTGARIEQTPHQAGCIGRPEVYLSRAAR